MKRTKVKGHPGVYKVGPCSCGQPKGRHTIYDVVVSRGFDPVTGTYPQKWERVHGQLTDADNARRALYEKRAKGELRRSGSSLNGLFDAWLADLERQRKAPNTIVGYRKDAAMYWRPTLGERPLHKVARADVRQILDDLTDRGVAPTTLHHVRACISSAFSWAVSEEWISAHLDPTKKIPLAAQVRRTPKVPNPTQVAAVISEAERVDQADMGRFLWLGAVTGARNSEIRALRLTDLDLDLGIVGIERAFSAEVEWTTKNKEVRPIGLDQVTLDVVRAQVAHLEQRALDKKVTLRPDAFLFTDDPYGAEHWGEQRVTRTVSTLFDHAMRDDSVTCRHAAGETCPHPGPLAHFTFKHLRKFMDTWGQELGFTIDDVAARAGHTAQVARAHYTGRREATDRRLSEGLAALLSPATPDQG